MDSIIIKKITDIVGSAFCTTKREDLHCYSFDGAGNIFLPEAVAFPDSTGQISAIMRLASEYGFPVVPRGAGTGMTGGAVPVRGGLVLALSRMNRIVEIDVRNQIAIVEPGVITGDLQDVVENAGLFYPPDPQSLRTSVLGGNIAHCAGGPRAFKYGVTATSVEGLVGEYSQFNVASAMLQVVKAGSR